VELDLHLSSLKILILWPFQDILRSLAQNLHENPSIQLKESLKHFKQKVHALELKYDVSWRLLAFFQNLTWGLNRQQLLLLNFWACG